MTLTPEQKIPVELYKVLQGFWLLLFMFIILKE